MSDDGQGTELEVGVAPDGFTAKIKSRMLSALDRFSGNKVAKRGLADERHVLIERTKHHQEAKAIEALGDLAVERIKGDPALVEQLLESHFPGMIRKQENVAGSLEHATEQLKLLPPPAAAETEDASDEVDPDWLNVWEGHAEKASSDRMRKLWGRILAGEVQREGSFSFNTLRIVSELDARTAAIFQREVKLKFLDSLLNDDDAKADVTDAIVLESIGLIHGVGSNLSKKLPLKVPGFLNFKMGVWALKVNLNDITAKTADFEVYPLTPAGLQLAAILQQDQEGTLRRVAKVLAGQSSKIVLFKLQNEQIVTPGEVLKETSHAQQAG